MKKKDRLRYLADNYKRKHNVLYKDIAKAIGIKNYELSWYMKGTTPTLEKKYLIRSFFKKELSYFW